MVYVGLRAQGALLCSLDCTSGRKATLGKLSYTRGWVIMSLLARVAVFWAHKMMDASNTTGVGANRILARSVERRVSHDDVKSELDKTVYRLLIVFSICGRTYV